MLPVAAVFCAIAGLFGAFSVISILQSLGLMSTASGRAGSPGAGACVLVFALPILGVGLWMLWSAAMAIGGRVEVTLRDDDLRVFTGVGPLGRSRHISAASIAGVVDHEEVIRTSRSPIRRRVILLRVPGGDGVMFGAALNQRRRDFMIENLQRVLGR